MFLKYKDGKKYKRKQSIIINIINQTIVYLIIVLNMKSEDSSICNYQKNTDITLW